MRVIGSTFVHVQAAVKKHREAVKYGKLAERLGAVASRIDTVSKMAVCCYHLLQPAYMLPTKQRPAQSEHGCQGTKAPARLRRST